MKSYTDYDVPKFHSIYDIFLLFSKEYKELVAFEGLASKITYHQLSRDIKSLTSRLEKYKGRYVLITAKDSYLFAVSYFGTIMAGAVAVLSDTGEQKIIEKMDIAITLNDEVAKTETQKGDKDYNPCICKKTDTLSTILFSSGTLSAQKGVMLSENNICVNVKSGLEKYLMKKGDRYINLIPYYHAFGLVCDLLAPLCVGATICMLDKRELFVQRMVYYKPTILNVPPAIAKTILKLLETGLPVESVTGGRLKKLLCGGAHYDKSTAMALEKYGIMSYGCYGTTECSPCISVNRDSYYKHGSAGVALNCNEIKLADDGEILIKGENVMLGYFNDDEATKKAIKDGYYHTGDLGFIDEDGFLYVTGRKSNLIAFDDGTKLTAEEVEQDILQNTEASEVLVYSESRNDKIAISFRIYVSDMKSQEAIKGYIKEKYKKYNIGAVEISNTPLPKTSIGKIRRTYEN